MDAQGRAPERPVTAPGPGARTMLRLCRLARLVSSRRPGPDRAAGRDLCVRARCPCRGGSRCTSSGDRRRLPPGSSSTVPASSHTRTGRSAGGGCCGPRSGTRSPASHGHWLRRLSWLLLPSSASCPPPRLLPPSAAGWGPRPSPSEVLQQGLRDHLAELVAGLGTVSREELAIHVGLAIGAAVDDAHTLRRQLLALEPGERPW